ncbi:MAG: SGNH/GDSL hydrolase family protein [Chlamydiae bacterium]|nr:SGNH/GDSL hydrolase family protein [Chlamydiota bacterium]MBI3266393.1 SGNH/GDSL hydrolase family protein [Chlamydiota bacterium]
MKRRFHGIILGIGILMMFAINGHCEAVHPWAVWSASDGNDLEIYASHEGDSSWNVPEKIHSDNAVSDTSPAIVIDSTGKAFVAWVRENGDKEEIYCSRWDGLRWSLEEPVGVLQGVRFSVPAVTVDDKGNPWIVASGVKNNGQDEIYETHRTVTGWTAWMRVNQEDASPDVDPTVMAYQDQVWVIWSGYDGENYQLFGRHSNGKSWTQEEKLFQGGGFSQSFPSLSVEGGKFKLSFYKSDEGMFSFWDGQNWSFPSSATFSLEENLINIWKSQAVYKGQTAWFEGPENRGAFNILLKSDEAKTSTKWVARLKKLFDISGNEAWAATANVYTAFGDSITEGGYPPFLQNRLSGATVVNRGRGGELTDGGLSRIGGVLAADSPEFILIMEGTNDAGNEHSQESIAFNLEQMVAKAAATGTKPILSTITPRKDNHNGKVEKVNALLREFAGSNGVPLTDNYAVIIAKPIAEFDSLYTDHLHFNSAGNDIIAQDFFDTINSVKGGGSGGGGGCGSVKPNFPSKWNLNLEPLLFSIFVFLILRKMRRVSKAR